MNLFVDALLPIPITIIIMILLSPLIIIGFVIAIIYQHHKANEEIKSSHDPDELKIKIKLLEQELESLNHQRYIQHQKGYDVDYLDSCIKSTQSTIDSYKYILTKCFKIKL